MPDREYYLDPSPHMATNREKYRAHIATVLRLAKIPDADAKAGRIYELEHRIAAVHWKREDSEHVRKADNHWSRADFDKRAPGLDWASFLRRRRSAEADRLPRVATERHRGHCRARGE